MTKVEKVHDLSKKQILKKALTLRRHDKLYNLRNDHEERDFRSGIDGFSTIACRLRYSRKVLDVGAGNGILVSLLSELGHECRAIDIIDLPELYPEIYKEKKISFQKCNVEVDDIPYPDGFFDAVVCSEVFEHFTLSHLRAMQEIYRVLSPGGTVVVAVPNAVCFRNRSRMIRGKHITWDYKKHYLHAEPVLYKGLSFFPDRHNREFTASELRLLLNEIHLRNIEVRFDKSRSYRTGFERIKSIGSSLRDLIPSLRKTLIAFGEKESLKGLE
ncbi:MAG TPA: class I SAM-dependent methyltransferase [Thermodesulfovibrionales bacterium]|nr:class I SAM-dependent methyltransferase [Thermodesulfovibrionales bacterium]